MPTLAFNKPEELKVEVLPTHTHEYHLLEIEQYRSITKMDYVITHPKMCFIENKCNISAVMEIEGPNCLRWGDLYKHIESPYDLPDGIYRIEYRIIEYTDYAMLNADERWVQIVERM